jgi:hypothetical protein
MKETCLSVVDTPRRELTRRCGIALVWFLASVLLAVEIPDIGTSTVQFLPFLFRVCAFRPFGTQYGSGPTFENGPVPNAAFEEEPEKILDQTKDFSMSLYGS